MALSMYHYIGEQQEVLRHILHERKSCTADFAAYFKKMHQIEYILLVAVRRLMGRWRQRPFMENVLGIEVTAHAASLLPVIRGKHPLLVFISQGGNSTNTLAAIATLHGYDFVALTGTEECRVNEVCGRHVLMACGPEEAGPKTKGYVSTVMTLYLMALEAALLTGLYLYRNIMALLQHWNIPWMRWRKAYKSPKSG